MMIPFNSPNVQVLSPLLRHLCPRFHSTACIMVNLGREGRDTQRTWVVTATRLSVFSL